MKNDDLRFANVTSYTNVDVQPGGINIQHVENLYQADLLKSLGIELTVKKPAADRQQDTPADATTEKATFGFIIYSHHSRMEIDAQMESLRIKCKGSNSRALMRMLNDLDKDGFIDISDVTAAELYAELQRVFGMPNIQQRTFAEAFRLIG